MRTTPSLLARAAAAVTKVFWWPVDTFGRCVDDWTETSLRPAVDRWTEKWLEKWLIAAVAWTDKWVNRLDGWTETWLIATGERFEAKIARTYAAVIARLREEARARWSDDA